VHTLVTDLQKTSRAFHRMAPQALFLELPLRERTMVMLAGSTGLRRSELFALRWSDIDFLAMEVAVTRSCMRNHFEKHQDPPNQVQPKLNERYCCTHTAANQVRRAANLNER
jgi:integrase